MKNLESAVESSERSDEELMAELSAGQTEALVPLHRRYAALVFNMSAQTLDRPAAEEIVQDVFTTIWSKAGTYDPARGSVRTWLLQIAHSRVLNELRRRNRRPQTVPDPDGSQLVSLPDESLTPDEETWLEFRREAVREAVESLPPAQRQALSLAYFEDLSHTQIADFLGLPLGTAKTRIRDGMKRLRHSLAAVVMVGLALVAGTGIFIRQYLEQRSDLNLNEDALGMVTMSDVQELHLSPSPGEPADAHGNYRVRPSGGLAILTVSNLPQLDDGSHYRVWADDGNGWVSLSTIDIDSNGHALVVIDGDTFGMPAAIEVTLETTESGSAPAGPVVISWAAQ